MPQFPDQRQWSRTAEMSSIVISSVHFRLLSENTHTIGSTDSFLENHKLHTFAKAAPSRLRQYIFRILFALAWHTE